MFNPKSIQSRFMARIALYYNATALLACIHLLTFLIINPVPSMYSPILLVFVITSQATSSLFTLHATYLCFMKHKTSHDRKYNSRNITSRRMAIYGHMLFLIFLYYRVCTNVHSLCSPYILVPTIGSMYSILYLFCVQEPTGNQA